MWVCMCVVKQWVFRQLLAFCVELIAIVAEAIWYRLSFHSIRFTLFNIYKRTAVWQQQQQQQQQSAYIHVV